jgi:NAD-dependent SIR2 family protein deacetylase
MNKRLKLQCWNCPKTYFETLEITDQQEVIVKCPYCQAEAVVNLKPYRKQPKTVFRGENKDTQSDEEFQFPDVLPTRKLE